jgi:putative SOS response-associated peptidase YedK
MPRYQPTKEELDRAYANVEPHWPAIIRTNERMMKIVLKLPEAMPAILTTPEEVDLWLTGPWDAVKHLQRPLPDDMLVIVEPPAQPQTEGTLL